MPSAVRPPPQSPVGVEPAVAGRRLVPPTVVPPPHPLDPIRFLWRFQKNPLLTLPAAVYEQPVVTLRSAGKSMAWICDPALIETVLLRDAAHFPKPPLERRIFGAALGNGILTAQGEDWRWQRKMAAPAFRAADLMAHVPEMAAAADAQIARWRRLPVSPDAADHAATSVAGDRVSEIEHDMSLATFDVLMRTIFAGATEQEADAILASGRAFLDKITWEVGVGILDIPTWVWHPGKRRTRLAARAMRRNVSELLARRRAEPMPRQDLLARLLAAHHPGSGPDGGRPLADDEIIDNLTTFLIAGHETTAKALTWALYLLALAPDWQDRVRGEVLRVAGNGAIEARHIDALVVTRQVLMEAMRLYPPVPVMTRLAAGAVTLGAHHFDKGTLLVFPIFCIHRHRMLWAEPDSFDPDRFAPGRDEGRPRAQFMPFGFGPRICIGQTFAMLEAMTLLASFVRAARFTWAGRHVPLPVSRITLRPAGGMPLAVTLV